MMAFLSCKKKDVDNDMFYRYANLSSKYLRFRAAQKMTKANRF
jgi:hypothetical protein